MPRSFPVTDEVRKYLAESKVAKTPYRVQAATLGCCIDTLKRMLVRCGLIDLQSAKYQLSVRFRTQYWERPCLGCQSSERRAKGLFFCSRCRAHQKEMGSFVDDTPRSLSYRGERGE